MRHPLLAAAVLTAGCFSALNAQTQNWLPVVLADAQGNDLPWAANQVPGEAPDVASVDGNVYFELGTGFPAGRYFVRTTNPGPTEALSTDPLSLRTWDVSIVGGKFVVTPADNTNPMVPGTDGAGNQTIPLGKYKAPSAGNPCRFKAWICSRDDFGDFANPGESYGLFFQGFVVGNGNPVDVCGLVFSDLDEDGVRDPGEPGIAGCTVRLSHPTFADRMTTTLADGTYCFAGVIAGDWTATLVIPSGFRATTPTSYPIEVGACTNVKVKPFGKSKLVMSCSGHTPGYWRNKHGCAYVLANNGLAKLNALGCLRDEAGALVGFSDIKEYKAFLKNGKATNMAYMLSVQFTAMFLNVDRGFVSPYCMVQTPTGRVSIADVLKAACDSLRAHGLTKSGHPERDAQEYLKNILDAANNNANWAN